MMVVMKPVGKEQDLAPGLAVALRTTNKLFKMNRSAL